LSKARQDLEVEAGGWSLRSAWATTPPPPLKVQFTLLQKCFKEVGFNIKSFSALIFYSGSGTLIICATNAYDSVFYF
jgi:hypothetical protein